MFGRCGSLIVTLHVGCRVKQLVLHVRPLSSVIRNFILTGELVICKHKDSDHMLALVVLVLAQSTFILVVLPFSDYQCPPQFSIRQSATPIACHDFVMWDCDSCYLWYHIAPSQCAWFTLQSLCLWSLYVFRLWNIQFWTNSNPSFQLLPECLPGRSHTWEVDRCTK